MLIGQTGGFDDVLLNMQNNESALGKLTNQLSSGLRINSAADDPSGLAIASSLQTESLGLDQGTQSIQNANNLITVADGAMSTITNILQRERSLIIEANSTVNSANDLTNIQAELTQLTQEINTIAANANFNGLSLFNGSLTSTPPRLTNPTLFVVNPNTDGQGANPPQPTATTPAGPPLIVEQTIDPNGGGTQAINGAEPVDVSFTVQSFDATTGLLTVSYTAESSDPNFGPPQTTTFQVAEGTNYPNGFPGPPPPGVPQLSIIDQNGNNVFGFSFNDLNRNDVGLTATVATVNEQSYVQGNAVSVNSGTDEGTTIGINIPAISAFNLGVSQLTVGDTLQSTASEGRVDFALQQVLAAQAQLGAQSVSLGEASNNNQINSLNVTASESEIRDLNVGQATTQFTKDQIMVSVGTSVLSQMEVNTKQLTSLLIASLNAA